MKKKQIAAVLCCTAAAAAVLYLGTHVRAAGRFFPKSAQTLDLTGENLSTEEYDAIRAALPDCEIDWLVPFQGSTYAPDTETITVSSLTMEDIAVLDYFPNLQTLDAALCTDYDALFAFEAHRPDCRTEYTVAIGSAQVPGHATNLTVNDADADELVNQLPLLHDLAQIKLTGALPEKQALDQLMEQFPQIDFRWTVPVGSTSMRNTVKRLDIHGVPLTAQSAAATLDSFLSLDWVDMRGCGLTDTEMIALCDAYPDTQFVWDMQLGEHIFSTDAEEIDLTGLTLENPEEIEKLLPYLPNAKKIILSHCGLDDETMDALDKRHEDVRFVWSVLIKDRYVRTDAKYFYPYKLYRKMRVNNEQLKPLKYCIDLECIDIGHMFSVTDCEWARNMPNLTYLIIGETGISDLSPLSGCKKLKYLELFTIPVKDYSPLLGCTALEYLNLGRTYGDPEPLGQMTWLKHLWWCWAYGRWGRMNEDRIEPVNKMIESLPDTEIKIFIEHPTAGGWRKLDGYFEMRDFMDMFYLT